MCCCEDIITVLDLDLWSDITCSNIDKSVAVFSFLPRWNIFCLVRVDAAFVNVLVQFSPLSLVRHIIELDVLRPIVSDNYSTSERADRWRCCKVQHRRENKSTLFSVILR